MQNGIYEVGRATLCMGCVADMHEDYVMNKVSYNLRGECERCGRKGYVCLEDYYMKWKVKVARGYVKHGV